MNKKDAAVYKALAECGFDFGNKNIPDPEKDKIVQIVSDPNLQHIEDVLRVLNKDSTLDEINEMLKKDTTYREDDKTNHNP